MTDTEMEKLIFSPATKALLEAKDEGGSQAELGRINQRLQELAAETRVLRALYNSKMPIAHLPPEVLCEIFMYLPLVEEPERETLSRFLVGQVCQRWRNIALECTELWSEISFDCSREVTQAMIARSGDSPISLMRDCRGAWSSVDLLCSVVGRLRVVQLVCDSEDTHSLPAILANFTSEAPALETLTLQCEHEEFDISILPTGFLNGGALSRLHLMTIACQPWTAIPFSAQITELFLGCAPTQNLGNSEHRNRPPFHSFFLTLTAIPYLQMIRLFGYLPEVDESQAEPSELPSFPALKEAVLYDYPRTLSSVLPFFRLSRGTELGLMLFEHATREDISQLLHSMGLLQAKDGASWTGEGEVHRLQALMPDFDTHLPKVHLWLDNQKDHTAPLRLHIGVPVQDLAEAMKLMVVDAPHCLNFSTTTSLELCGDPASVPGFHLFLDIPAKHLLNLQTIIF
ncbi:hypothetical protein NMY22_g16424 [Coprinellus aureogranulatus]|nr:hypothetical protein NMY22_g16424 [Coprinellus aureogranulatus]